MIMGRKNVLIEGIVVGLAGATAVAIWFLLYDLAEGVPFRTPALLAAALFHGLRDAGALTITPGLVLEYSMVHGVAFILSVSAPPGCSPSSIAIDESSSRCSCSSAASRSSCWP
jgi:hypothetical protein